ncbi:MFS transporter [Metabacillus bambusae]|uniref:MFS transporter n=1 Tax=Metabacillus bambusae TaxID=2795218 RepID=A0ABS3MZX5_9BACI|nr:MFS transporter [Metabacillus bambusae]MBO1511419.1 MFS transporter [Metabacillus bambusae]
MKEQLWTKDFIFLALSNTFLFLAFEMLLPTLPAFISAGGGTDSSIGIIMGIFTITAILSRPLTDWGVKKFGKKSLLLIGVFICLLASAGYYLSAIAIVIVMFRLLHGIGFGFATTLYGTIAAEIVPESRRGEGLGFFAIGATLAASIGPFIGILLIEDGNFNHFFIIVCLVLVATLFFTNFIKASHIKEPDQSHKQEKWYKRIIVKEAVFPAFFVMLLGVSYGGILSFITLFGKESNIDNIGYFFLIVPLFEFLVRLVAGRVFDQYGPFPVLVPGAIFCLIGILFLAYSTSLTMLLISGAFYGIGYGAIFPTIQAWIINRVTNDKQTIATATFYNFFDLGIGIGAFILGIIAGITSYSTMYMLSAFIFVIFLGVYLASYYSKKTIVKKGTMQM